MIDVIVIVVDSGGFVVVDIVDIIDVVILIIVVDSGGGVVVDLVGDSVVDLVGDVIVIIMIIYRKLKSMILDLIDRSIGEDDKITVRTCTLFNINVNIVFINLLILVPY